MEGYSKESVCRVNNPRASDLVGLQYLAVEITEHDDGGITDS